MVTLLARLFIRNWNNTADPAVRRAYGTLCSVFGIFLNILLSAGKFVVGAASGSVAITADAANNLSDAGSSLITLAGFFFAGRQADDEHPFGHGRAEYISGLAVSAVILIMGFDLAKTSFSKILHPSPVDTGWASFVVLGASILVKLYMFFYNRKIGRKIDSGAMRATALDSFSDVAATSVVLLSAAVSAIFKLNIDGWCGAAVSLFICYSGINAARDTLSPLLGSAPDPEFVRQVEEIVLAHPEISGIHDLIVHDYGPGRRIISLHGEVDGRGDIYVLHGVIDAIEIELARKLHCEAVIHMDPVAVEDERTVKLRSMCLELAQQIDPRIAIHDFRIVPSGEVTNLVFDAVVPKGFKLRDDETRRRIVDAVQHELEGCRAVVKIDRSYI